MKGGVKVKYTPIIFSTEMVPKILDGTKTQTRRTYGLDEINRNPDKWILYDFHSEKGVITHTREPNKKGQFVFWQAPPFHDAPDGSYLYIKCPYGRAGDRLWVRETWATEKRLDKFSPSELGNAGDVALWFSISDRQYGLERGRWRSSIHMPRWASRITLENVIDPYPQRLQEISEEDAHNEGFEPCENCRWARHHFMVYWDSLNAKRGYGWENNNWVWVITFRLP